MRNVPANRFESDRTFFVTSTLSISRPLFADAQNAQCILDTWDFYRARSEIELYGFVVMQDHIHLIVQVLSPLTLDAWMNRFKSYVAHKINCGPMWTRSYWSEVVVNEKFLRQKLHYIHLNPVRAGLVAKPELYYWSSARDYANEAGPWRVDL
ncbi:MAG TPA: transposase [bacterium]